VIERPMLDFALKRRIFIITVVHKTVIKGLHFIIQ